jgi:hypothetical protein
MGKLSKVVWDDDDNIVVGSPKICFEKNVDKVC